jgi:hypothetical protein
MELKIFLLSLPRGRASQAMETVGEKKGVKRYSFDLSPPPEKRVGAPFRVFIFHFSHFWWKIF